jgi:xanthine dehydrogenase molybdopterin-binding subunit B
MAALVFMRIPLLLKWSLPEGQRVERRAIVVRCLPRQRVVSITGDRPDFSFSYDSRFLCDGRADQARVPHALHGGTAAMAS